MSQKEFWSQSPGDGFSIIPLGVSVAEADVKSRSNKVVGAWHGDIPQTQWSTAGVKRAIIHTSKLYGSKNQQTDTLYWGSGAKGRIDKMLLKFFFSSVM